MASSTAVALPLPVQTSAPTPTVTVRKCASWAAMLTLAALLLLVTSQVQVTRNMFQAWTKAATSDPNRALAKARANTLQLQVQQATRMGESESNGTKEASQQQTSSSTRIPSDNSSQVQTGNSTAEWRGSPHPASRKESSEVPESTTPKPNSTQNSTLEPSSEAQTPASATVINVTNTTKEAPTIQQNSTTDSLFEGSKITRLSSGLEVFENVCLKRLGRTYFFHSYTQDANDMASTICFRKQMFDIHRTYGRPLEQWQEDSERLPLIRTNVLFTESLFENPGHCLNDYLFPLIRDRYERKTLKEDKNGPEYPTWMRMARTAKVTDYNPDSYCNQLLQAGQFVDVQGFLAHPKMCFERVYLPATEQQRFPFSKEMIQMAGEEMQLGARRVLLRGGANLTAPPYPSEALREFRNTLWKNMGLKSDPWEEQEYNVIDKVGPRMLFYNRFGSRQRQWQSSLEVAKILEEGYHVKIDVMGEEWNDMNFTQQAALYNSYSHIVTVHGAHLTNLLFSRPGTQVVEIVPIAVKQLRPDPALTHKEDAKDQRAWYGPLGWFSSWTRQVGIEHFCLHAEDHLVTIENTNKGMDINATRAASFIVNRFGLKALDNRN